jgi:hypothetical protein
MRNPLILRLRIVFIKLTRETSPDDFFYNFFPNIAARSAVRQE